jgi:transposase-like protein
MTRISEKGLMKKTRDGRRRFTREFKVAAVRRVIEGERLGAVARDLNLGYELLWGWKRRVAEKGEEHLYDIGRRSGEKEISREGSDQRRIAELERLAEEARQALVVPGEYHGVATFVRVCRNFGSKITVSCTRPGC